jgi:hypothetical protein
MRPCFSTWPTPLLTHRCRSGSLSVCMSNRYVCRFLSVVRCVYVVVCTYLHAE